MSNNNTEAEESFRLYLERNPPVGISDELIIESYKTMYIIGFEDALKFKQQIAAEEQLQK